MGLGQFLNCGTLETGVADYDWPSRTTQSVRLSHVFVYF